MRHDVFSFPRFLRVPGLSGAPAPVARPKELKPKGQRFGEGRTPNGKAQKWQARPGSRGPQYAGGEPSSAKKRKRGLGLAAARARTTLSRPRVATREPSSRGSSGAAICLRRSSC